MQPKTFLSYIFISLILLAVTVTAFNFFIDPYLLFDSKRIASVNEKKSDINNFIPVSKAYHPLAKRPDLLIVGNSRVEMGLNPRHACLKRRGGRPYNLGIPGIGVSSQLTYALNIIRQSETNEVFLALDFTDFLTTSKTPPDKKYSLAPAQVRHLKYRSDGSLNPTYQTQRSLDYYRALFSLNALASSITTVFDQGQWATNRDDYGFNPANDFKKVTAIEGPQALFAQKLADLNKKYSRQWYLRYQDGTLPDEFERLRDFLVTAKERNVRVTLFTNPLHNEFWRLMKKHDLMETYRDWLTAITELLAGMDDQNIAFWDFSYDSPYIHEIVPPPGKNAKPLQWFWEPAHYRQELGDLMLDAMLSGQCGSKVVFGNRIQY